MLEMKIKPSKWLLILRPSNTILEQPEKRGNRPGEDIKSYLTEQKEVELAECLREMGKNIFGLSR